MPNDPGGGLAALTAPCGHVGLFMSHRTVGDTWPGIAGWIRRSDPNTEGA